MTTADENQSNAGMPLESWKEIAAYLQRDISTVIRWEKHEGLPVRRHHHLSRSSVYAYPSELEAWRTNRRPSVEVPGRVWRRPLPSAAFAVTLLLALALAGSVPRVGSVQAADGIVTRQVWSGVGVGLDGSVSPDGRYLTFADWSNAYGELAIRDLDTGESRHLTDDGGNTPRNRWANRSVFSPDGREVAYSWFNEDLFYELRTVGLDGSPSRVLRRSAAENLEPVDWSADGKSILVWKYREWPPSSSQIVTVSIEDGKLSVLKNLEGQVPTKMSLSPDGRYLAYDRPPVSGSSNHDIFLLAVGSGSEVAVIEHPANDCLLDWTPDGNAILFASDRAGEWGAYMVPISNGAPQGSPRLVKSSIGQIRPLGFALSGAFYYGVGGWAYDVYTVDVDLATGKVLGSPTLAVQRFVGSNRGASYSPDGESLVYASRRTPASKSAAAIVVCLRDLRSGQERELSPDLNWLDPPQWSPDGRSLLVTGFDRRSRLGVFRIDSRTGELAAVLESGKDLWTEVVPPQWSHDGKSIYYVRCDGRIRRCRLLSRNLSARTEKVVAEIEGEKTGFIEVALSGDGSKLAASIWDDNRKLTRLVTMAAAGGAMTELMQQQGAEPVRRLAWTPGGKQLLFVRRTDAPAAQRRAEVWCISAEGGSPRNLGLSAREIDRLAVHPDGRRVAYSASEHRAEVWRMENFLPRTEAEEK